MDEITGRFLNALETLVKDHKAKSVRQIAIRIGMNPSQISEAKKGVRDVPDVHINSIDAIYNVNKEYIIKGEGGFYKSEQNVNKNLHNKSIHLNVRSVTNTAPYYENISASAGLDILMENKNEIPSAYIKVPGIMVDAYINVFGDSMYPKYCAGEIIGVKEVQKDDLFFGHAYVVRMSDGEAYIKYIRPGKDDDHWSLESENEKYPPRQFHLSKINKIFKIKTIITRASL